MRGHAAPSFGHVLPVVAAKRFDRRGGRRLVAVAAFGIALALALSLALALGSNVMNFGIGLGIGLGFQRIGWTRVFLFGLVSGQLGLLLGDQRLAVGNGDLIIVGMNFAERQEAVPVAAVFDERRLQGRFNPGHFG